MIIQPEEGTRNVNDVFYKAEKVELICLIENFFKMWNLQNQKINCLFGYVDWIHGLLTCLYQF